MAIKITYDENTHSVCAGEFQIKSYKPDLLKRLAWVDAVIKANNIKISVQSLRDKKAWNKGVCDALGCSSVTLHKHFVKLMKKVYIAEMIPLVKNRPYTHGKKWDHYLIKANHNYKIMRQLKEDGLEKLGPLCAITGKTPQELRDICGKGAWKKIHNSSPTRIGLISQYDFSENFAAWEVPSSVLKSCRGRFISKEYFDWVVNKCKGQWGNARELLSLRLDYYRMANILGVEPVELNGKNVKRLHDELQKELWLRRDREAVAPFLYDKDYTDILGKVTPPTGYSLHVFQDGSELFEEGREMRHCVGSYVAAVRRGTSLIVSLRKDGERYSTLEWRRDDGEWCVSQNMQKCNKPVKDSTVTSWVIKMTQALGKA